MGLWKAGSHNFQPRPDMKYQAIALPPSSTAVNGGEVTTLQRTTVIVAKIMGFQSPQKILYYSAHVRLRIPLKVILYLLSGDNTSHQNPSQELPDRHESGLLNSQNHDRTKAYSHLPPHRFTASTV
jgi:hypothetical protein